MYRAINLVRARKKSTLTLTAGGLEEKGTQYSSFPLSSIVN